MMRIIGAARCWAWPNGKAGRARHRRVDRGAEVAVVRDDPTRELPDALLMVEFGTVGREEVQAQNVTVLPQPGPQGRGVVPSGIVHDGYDLPIAPAMPQKNAQECAKGVRVECPGALGDEISVRGAHRSKDRQALARWRLQDHGVHFFGRHPHRATRTVLLEMALVLKPQIEVFSSGPFDQFFYMPAGLPGWLWR